MSRSYGMTLTITGHNRDKRTDIIDAAMGEWNFDSEFIDYEGTDDERIVLGEGLDNLCGGESEDEFADRVAKAVMQANGGPCVMEVGATCYEYIPCEIHERGQEFWDEWHEDEDEEQRRDEKRGLYPEKVDIAN